MSTATTFPLAKKENKSMSNKTGIPSPFGFGGQNPNLPPELAKKVDDIARSIQPQLQALAQIVYENNLNCFDMIGGVQGIEVHLGVHNPNAPHDEFMDEMPDGKGFLESLGIRLPKSARVVAAGKVPLPAPHQAPTQEPAPDLLAGIEQVLRRIYKEEDAEILGMTYSPHKSAAYEIGKIMEAARKRDQREFANELEKLVKRFRT